jgi:hypothetical protein
MLRAHVLARIVFDAWRGAGLTLEGWRELQPVLHDEFALLVEEAYHETNRWLVGAGRAARGRPAALHPPLAHAPERALGWQAGSGSSSHRFGPTPAASRHRARPGGGRRQRWARGVPHRGDGGSGGRQRFCGSGGFGQRGGGAAARAAVGDETRLMTRAAPLARSREHAEAVLGRLNRLVGRHVPGFAGAAGRGARPVGCRRAWRAPSTPRSRAAPALSPTTQRGEPMVTTPVLLDELHQRKQALKKAAATPEERATIEIVALLFQSILTEDRIPAACACGSRGCRCRCCAWRSPSPTSSPPSTTRRAA